MTKKQQQPAPTPATAAQLLESQISLALYSWREDAKQLAALLRHLSEDTARKREHIQEALERYANTGTVTRGLVSRLGEVQSIAREINLACRSLEDGAREIEALRAVYNRLTDEQDAARMALAVVGEVVAAEIEQAKTDEQARLEGWQAGVLPE
jgi:DNA repair ATPase RecN